MKSLKKTIDKMKFKQSAFSETMLPTFFSF